jgi:hypothetical protein
LKRIYYDYEQFREEDGPTSLFISDAEAVPAGTEVFAIPVKYKSDEYAVVAGKTGVHFIFEDGILEKPFYSVPYLCIFATDGGEGFFACRQIPDLASEEPIYYVPGREKVYQVAESLEELISGGQRWQKKMRWSKKIKLYDSKSKAEANEPFVSEGVITDCSART